MGLFTKAKGEVSAEVCITCDAVMDISRAAEFRQELKSALGKGGAVLLDGAAIEKIDTAILQLCVAFFHAAAARKIQAKWQTPSGPLVRAAGLLGLRQKLGLPEGN